MDNFGGIAFFCGSCMVVWSMVMWVFETLVDFLRSLAAAV